MSNFVKYNDAVAFHPGYYIEEYVEAIGITQADFAKRLDTTPKNLSILINGKQKLSPTMAMKLSRMLGTTLEYWLNLQVAYDTALEQIAADEELEQEKSILRMIGYGYFRDHFHLPELPRKVVEQVQALRTFLHVSSLTTLQNKDLATSFRSSKGEMSVENIVKANAMVLIATNMAAKTDAPKYDKHRFEAAVEFALTQTQNHDGFFPLIKEAFREAGVILTVLPNLPGSKTNGATKKIGGSVMIMVNDRRLYADTFWFTLMHEIGHVINGDYGVSLEDESGEFEQAADEYAQDKLIDSARYVSYVSSNHGQFNEPSIKAFAASINRDPGIVLGRLEHDGYVRYNNGFQSLRRKYSIAIG